LPPLFLYVHLPWCLAKCPYCDFNSHALRLADLHELPEQRYLAALQADLNAALPLIWGRTVQGIFIGGGTPSLFSASAIDLLLGHVRSRVRLLPGCEITLEANPSTALPKCLKAYRHSGVTRLSLGVQSFQDAFLQSLGRVHDRDQALAAATAVAQTFDTFNLDLMYALPDQTLEHLQHDLAVALSFAPTHLSVYQLTIEANTRFAIHPPSLPDDDTSADMLDLITLMTQSAGLDRYEVSAFARPGHRCRHNLNYWQFGDYLGIGAGAHSKISLGDRITRQVRLSDPDRYMTQALAGCAVAKDDVVCAVDLPFEFMLGALRLKEGFALALLSERTGLAVGKVQNALDKAVRQGLLVCDGVTVTPTARGVDMLNDLVSLFLPNAAG